jgi:hypothetical protein
MGDVQMSKYDGLRDFLAGRGPSVVLTFDEIDRLVGGLPPSAATYEAWWSNGDRTHVQSMSWGTAGYDAHPDLFKRAVTFSRR